MEKVNSWYLSGANTGSEESYLDIVAPWPKEPVCFKTEIVGFQSDMKANYEGALEFRFYKELTPLIGKSVHVTVEELP